MPSYDAVTGSTSAPQAYDAVVANAPRTYDEVIKSAPQSNTSKDQPDHLVVPVETNPEPSKEDWNRIRWNFFPHGLFVRKSVQMQEMYNEKWDEELRKLSAPRANDEVICATSAPRAYDALIGSTSASQAYDAVIGSTSAPRANDEVVGATSAPRAYDAVIGGTSAPRAYDAVIGSTSAPRAYDEVVGITYAPQAYDAVIGSTSAARGYNAVIGNTSAPRAYDEVISPAPKIDRSDPQQQPLTLWSKDRCRNLDCGSSDEFEDKVEILIKGGVDGVQKAIGVLNTKEGHIACPEGFCVVYSKETNTYHLLCRKNIDIGKLTELLFSADVDLHKLLYELGVSTAAPLPPQESSELRWAWADARVIGSRRLSRNFGGWSNTLSPVALAEDIEKWRSPNRRILIKNVVCRGTPRREFLDCTEAIHWARTDGILTSS